MSHIWCESGVRIWTSTVSFLLRHCIIALCLPTIDLTEAPRYQKQFCRLCQYSRCSRWGYRGYRYVLVQWQRMSGNGLHLLQCDMIWKKPVKPEKLCAFSTEACTKLSRGKLFQKKRSAVFVSLWVCVSAEFSIPPSSWHAVCPKVSPLLPACISVGVS